MKSEREKIMRFLSKMRARPTPSEKKTEVQKEYNMESSIKQNVEKPIDTLGC